jgi:hypothetical protein
MFGALKKMLKDCLTENDGASYCPFRLGGFALSGTGIPTFIGCSVWQTFNGHFDSLAFGTAFAAMMGGMAMLAGGVAMKAKTDTN